MKITLLGETRDPKKYRAIHIRYNNNRTYLIEEGLRVSSIYVNPTNPECNERNLARITDAEYALENETGFGFQVLREIKLPNHIKRELKDLILIVEQKSQIGSTKIDKLLTLKRNLRQYMFNGS